MQSTTLNLIECLACHSSDWKTFVEHADAVEIREGEIECRVCHHRYSITRGVLDMLLSPSETVTREQNGWVELLGETSDELVETMLELPYLADPLWVTQAENFDQFLNEFDVRGKVILDVGSGRCWSARRLIQAGAASVTAVDILRELYIGLETSEIYMQEDGIVFERIMADMHNLPFAQNKFDLVFVNATLHHSSDLFSALSEFARVLVEQGHLVLLSEPVCGSGYHMDINTSVELQHGVNEHVYKLSEYLDALVSTGFECKLLFPAAMVRHWETRIFSSRIGRLFPVLSNFLARRHKQILRFLSKMPFSLLNHLYSSSAIIPLVTICVKRSSS